MAASGVASFTDLYSYDAAIENAWRDILTDAFAVDGIVDKNGVVPTAFIAHDDLGKNTPFVDIQMRDSVGLKHRKLLPGNIGMYNAFDAHLVSRVVTSPGTNSDLQSRIIGICRAQAANFAEVFTAFNLPFHTMLDMRDSGLHRGVLKEPPLDWSEVFHLCTFAIREDAW
jgi:hypothetical protein